MAEVTTSATEGSVVKMIGASFSGAGPVTEPVEIEHFDFDAGFQSKVAAFAVRDDEFMRRVHHLLRPEFFENVGEAALVNIALRHFQKYRCVPDPTSMVLAIKDDVAAKIIRKDITPMVVSARKDILAAELRNREYVEDKVVEFVRHQALGAALMQSIDLREKGQFDKIEALVKQAIEIGLNEDGDAYDYFDRIEDRTEQRLDAAAGKRPPQGITTGVHKMDEVLYHRGWGRKELATIMGGAKAGKTTALINFAKSASLAGFNVLYVTLEVGSKIIGDRLDACLSDTLMKELGDKIHDVHDRIQALGAKAGKLIIHEFPSGTLSSSMLRKLIDRYKSPGLAAGGGTRPATKFDMVVVDYADIMAPNFRTQDPIENSKSVYVDLRAIAFEENVAMLTATQTNREGYKAAVAKAEHVAEDFNKVRTVDLMISINKTEEEAARGEARLYFAASRNQEAGFSIVIKQDLAMMQFIQQVLRIE